jgi:hypothetical protein
MKSMVSYGVLTVERHHSGSAWVLIKESDCGDDRYSILAVAGDTCSLT